MSCEFDLSGLRLRFDGLDAPLTARLAATWQPYRTFAAGAPFASYSIRLDARPATFGEYRPKAMQAGFGARGATFRMAEGEAEVEATGNVGVRLVTAAGIERSFFTLQNLVRATLAWLLPGRGGAALHAAGIVADGRAFVLVGPEGAGKSSFARLAAETGTRVLSDDFVLVDGDGDGFAALGAPFRSTHPVGAGPGRFPLAGVLFAGRATRHRLTPAPPLLCQARLLANLPFVAEAVGQDARVGAVVERLARGVPCAELQFALDPGFVELLRAWPAR